MLADWVVVRWTSLCSSSFKCALYLMPYSFHMAEMFLHQLKRRVNAIVSLVQRFALV